ncbi:hypothetical protein [Acidaminobacterium chupaoyuni]
MDIENECKVCVTIDSLQNATWQGKAQQNGKVISFESELGLLKALEVFLREATEE